MMKLDIDKESSRALNVLHLVKLMIHRHITPSMFGTMCGHMFEHDLSREQRAVILERLTDAIIRQHNTFIVEFGPLVDQASWMKDQHFATVRDIITCAFKTAPEHTEQDTLVVQPLNLLGQIATDIPLWIKGGVILFSFPFKRENYTEDERAIIINETLAECQEIYEGKLTKVQHMREGEDW